MIRMRSCMRSGGRWLLFINLVVSAWLAPPSAPGSAHALNDGYSMLTVTEQGLEYDLYLPRASLVMFDSNGDGQLSDAELESQRTAISDYLRASLSVSSGGVPLNFSLTRIDPAAKGDGQQIGMHMLFSGATGENHDLRVEYGVLVKDHDPDHVSYVYLFDGEVSRMSLLDAGNPVYEYKRDEAVPALSAMWRFLVLGVEHIWLGIDHLLFLLALMIAARERRDMIKIITVFTVAHSVTLILTAMGWIAAPPWVEAAIALSIIYVAAENLWFYRVARWRLGVVFGFGLFHGMGFAGALMEIGMPRQHTLASLIAFNVGVEAGQLILCLVVLPVLLWLRRKPGYPKAATGLSFAVMLIAFYWLMERLGYV